jgi:FkbM family methyltransferase
MIKYLKNFIKKIIFKFVKIPVKFEFNSYSQAGEDIILNFLFETMGIRNPTYIDIGANKPDFGSNTYKFYLNGCTGICIEPDYNLFNAFKKARPRDLTLNVAIGFNGQSKADFFVFNEPSLNTMSKEEAYRRDAIGEYKLTGVVTIEVEKLESIIEKYSDQIPTFISLDVEGIDFEILKHFNFSKYPVPIFIVETIDYSTNHIKIKNHELIAFMINKGYFVYADTYVNTIFVFENWFYNYQRP